MVHENSHLIQFFLPENKQGYQKVSKPEKEAQTGFMPDLLLQDDYFMGHLASYSFLENPRDN